MVPLKPQISPVMSIALRNMEKKYMHTSLPPLPIFLLSWIVGLQGKHVSIAILFKTFKASTTMESVQVNNFLISTPLYWASSFQ